METLEEPENTRLLRPCEAAAIYGVNPKTIGNWASAGLLTVHRTVGRHRRYRESEIRELIAGSTRVAARSVAPTETAAAALTPGNASGPPQVVSTPTTGLVPPSP